MESTANITEDSTILSKESDVKMETPGTAESELGTRYRLRVIVPKFASVKMIKDLLAEKGCEKVQVKKAPKWEYCLINPKTENQQLDIMDKLKGAKLKNTELYIRKDNYTEKGRQAYFDRRKNKKQKIIKQADIQKSPEERLADQVTPLHAYEYQAQLELKQSGITKSLETFRDNLREYYDKSQSHPSWLFDSELPLDLQPMIHSPILEGYRNKCEFTIGLNLEGEKTVGFLLGGYKDGLNIVIKPDNTIHVSDVAKKIATSMQNYILQSVYDVYDWNTKQGNWRQITVRSQKCGDVMIIVQMHPQELSKEQIDQEKVALSEHFNAFAKEEGFNLASMLIQMHKGVNNGISDNPFDCISGTPFIHEEMLNCRFRISPRSFFQTNTAGAELLYQKCGDIIKEIYMSKGFSESPKLLDMCCGTGTIGIVLSKNFENIIKEVVGIEICKEAVEDAEINASLNGINNVRYILGSVEESLFALYETFGTAIAIVDPPRSGVHKNVIKAIRKCQAIEHLIYISCDHNAAIKNFTELCRPTTKKLSPGIPFKPVKAIGVDLFPHAKHVELIIEFHRYREDSIESTDIPSISASQDTEANG